MFHGRKIFLGSVTAILVTAGVSAFTCNVCLPEVKGNKASKDTAMLVRANITRMWPDIPERDMGECTHLERSAKFMLECPIDDEFSACSKIHNDDWFALTCGRLTKARGAGCYNMKGDYKLCNCVTPLCNSPAGIPMPVPALLTASLAAVLMKLLL
ncbi:hypothetical protein FHG87_007531 [Trinorchestia longiramus]|nr:hypothetical protein FHG87_007531 [Trinorchestia longiramus]